MILTFSPLRMDATLSVDLSGDVITLNGVGYDLSPLVEGAVLPAFDAAVIGPVTRKAGDIRLTLCLPHGMDAPDAVRFPAVVSDPADAAGLIPWDGPVTQGEIDWTQMQTVEQIAAARLEDWRDTARSSRLHLCLGMAQAGLISAQSMVAAAQGQVPPEFLPAVEALPEAARLEVMARWAGAQDITRRNPFIAMVQVAAGLTEAQVDALFGWPG